MEFSKSDENEEVTLSKFESMLKTNSVFFFDSNEFENIIHHYLESGKIALAKKAIKLGLSQHPASLNLKLFKIETLIFENKLNEADRLLSPLFEIEPNNEELYIQKANIYSKQIKTTKFRRKKRNTRRNKLFFTFLLFFIFLLYFFVSSLYLLLRFN